MHAVGRRLPRPDSLEKVLGEAVFAADFRLPNELVGRILPSPHAHAEILSIDTSRAEQLPGVWAVVTASDIPAAAKYDHGSRFHAFLARSYVVFQGQALAAVAAADVATAEQALELIDVQYRLLPVVATIQQALEPDSAPVLHAPAPISHSSGSGHTQ
jgi:CO/xanthine dehydrogenase Mo-binding subunit